MSNDRLKYWRVSYPGLWLGGIAIVVSETKQDAIAAVSSHEDTFNFDKVTCEEIFPSGMGVLYNDNGDC